MLDGIEKRKVPEDRGMPKAYAEIKDAMVTFLTWGTLVSGLEIFHADSLEGSKVGFFP